MSWKQKMVLLAAGLLVAGFAFTLHDDWVHFNQNLPLIMEVNKLDDLSLANEMFLGIIIYRAALFLIPPFILAASTLVIYVHENKYPNERFALVRLLFHTRPRFRT